MEILNKIKSVKLCLIAHPDNEQDSEFADRISDLEEIENELSKENWIKLNKKATNLPKTDCYCWLRVKDDFGEYHVLTGHYSDGGKHFYSVITATITHYQIIEKPIDPLI